MIETRKDESGEGACCRSYGARRNGVNSVDPYKSAPLMRFPFFGPSAFVRVGGEREARQS